MANSNNTACNALTLGLDVGANSIGWVLVDPDKEYITASGVRLFHAGVEGDIEAGRDQSRTTARREARQTRRQLWRRNRRLRKLARIFQTSGLMPNGLIDDPDHRHRMLAQIDKDLRHGLLSTQIISADDRRAAHLLHFLIRTRALDHKIDKHALGRILYHLAQHRGFNSNRRGEGSEQSGDEDLGKVKSGIKALEQEITDAGARTLGEYFAGLDPEQQRIRTRWTSRQMHEDEFNAIWQAQCPHYPDVLTDKLRCEVYNAIFYQRPLKSCAHLVGHCSVYTSRRRAPLALPIAQRFRVLQKVNDLELCDTQTGDLRCLQADERSRLIEQLNSQRTMTFGAIRRLLGLRPHIKFNLEAGGEKQLPGNATRSSMLRAIGDRWDEFDTDTQRQIVLDVLAYQKRNRLIERGRKVWGLTAEGATALADLSLESRRASFCEQALGELVDKMSDGMRLGTARKELWPEQFTSTSALDKLPPVRESLTDLTNPAVIRALTESVRLSMRFSANMASQKRSELSSPEIFAVTAKNGRSFPSVCVTNRPSEKKQLNAF